MSRGGAAALAAAALVLPVACGGTGGDKAGGGADGPALVLTLESEDDVTITAAPEFADAVERLSGGAVRIAFEQAGRGSEIGYERGLVEDVRAGKAQLGIVGVRVWSRLGVTSFQALVAPFLVDSLGLQQRVVASPLAGPMLAGVEDAGVVGIALLPGPLRRPFGLSHALVGPEDYRGATVGIVPGGVAAETFRRLGAEARGYVPGRLSGLDGAELDPTTIAYNGFDRAGGALTTNVVLWPKPYSIVMNRRAYGTLTQAQQDLLRRAGREAVAPELRQLARDEATALSAACERGRLSFEAASPGQLAALREAVGPLYDELDRDPLTSKAVASIAAMRSAAVATAAVPCARGGTRVAVDAAAASPLEGRWRWSWTRAELLAAGIAPADASGLVGNGFVDFEDGRFRGMDGRGAIRSTGTYTLDGDRFRLRFDAPAPPGTVAGVVYELRWSRYRDALRFSRVPGREPLLALLIEPFRRVA